MLPELCQMQCDDRVSRRKIPHTGDDESLCVCGLFKFTLKKIDWVGPIDNRRSTDHIHHNFFKAIFTHDM